MAHIVSVKIVSLNSGEVMFKSSSDKQVRQSQYGWEFLSVIFIKCLEPGFCSMVPIAYLKTNIKE